MVKFTDLLERIEITPKLIYYIDRQYSKLMAQIRFSLGKLSGFTSLEVNRLFALLGITFSDFGDILKEYPKNVYVMQQPVYNLLTLIIVKAHLEGNERLAMDTNILLGLAFLGRLKYKYIRVVDQNLFDKTVSKLSKKTYIGMHGTQWMINKVCEDAYGRWMPLMEKDPNNMYPRYRYIIDMRNKFNQIVKTLARAYYYQYQHKNDVDRSVMLHQRANEILNYLLEKTLSDDIVEFIATTANMSIDRVIELQHLIQTYNSMQTQMLVIIKEILDRLLAVIENYAQVNDVNINVRDPIWIRSFTNALKRSTIILKCVSHEVFQAYHYDRFEILIFAFISVLFIDFINHADTYTNKGNLANDDFSSNYSAYVNYDSDDFSNQSTFGEALEMLFEGVDISNKELIDW